MARIRTIKPELPHSQSMGNVSRDARLLFILLWGLCDDHGKARGSSSLLAGLLFPYDRDAPDLIDGWIDELMRERCIERYGVDGAIYVRVLNWRDHQRIEKPSATRFPDPSPNGRGGLVEEQETPPESSALDQGSGKGPKDPGRDRGPKERDRGRAREAAAAAALPAVQVFVPIAIPAASTDPPETEAYRRWQEVARLEGWPEAGFLNAQRRRQLQARLAQCGGIEGWTLALAKARDAEFLRSTNGGPQRWFDLDWLLDERKFTRLMEGRYAERHRDDKPTLGGALAALAAFGREDDR